MLDRVFLLLETQEEAVKNAPSSPLIGNTIYFVSVFMQALTLGDPLRDAVEEKIIDYFLKSTPLKAAKISAQIIENLVTTNPNKWAVCVTTLLDEGVLSASYAAEKIAFRIRLVAGACKQASGEVLSSAPLPLSLLERVYSSKVSHLSLLQYPCHVCCWQVFTAHNDKIVRKATLKLIKNILKGATAFYPIDLLPLSYPGQVIGSPNNFSPNAVYLPH